MSVISGYMQKRAIEKSGNQAAQAQREGIQMGVDEQRRQFDLSRTDMAPWMAAGTNALYDMQDLLGMESTLAPWQTEANAAREKAIAEAQGMPEDSVSGGLRVGRKKAAGSSRADALAKAQAMPSYALPARKKRTPEEMVMQDPSYLWRRDQGRKAVEGSAAARGGLFSGNALKALDDYGQNAGLSEYTNIFNRLAGISGTGQTTAATTGAWGNQFGRDAAAGYRGMGEATGNAILNKGQAQAGFYGNLGNMAKKAATAYFMGA
jgi:hypothetical protein